MFRFPNEIRALFTWANILICCINICIVSLIIGFTSDHFDENSLLNWMGVVFVSTFIVGLFGGVITADFLRRKIIKLKNLLQKLIEGG